VIGQLVVGNQNFPTDKKLLEIDCWLVPEQSMPSS